MASYSDLTDEDIDKLVALGEIPDKQSFLNQQMNTAAALRDAPIEGMNRSNGRVMTAQTPIGILGQLAGKIGGGALYNRGLGQQQQLLDQQAAGRKQYFDMIRRGVNPNVGSLYPTSDSGQA